MGLYYFPIYILLQKLLSVNIYNIVIFNGINTTTIIMSESGLTELKLMAVICLPMLL